MSIAKDTGTNAGERPVLSETAHKFLLLYFGILATAIEESYGLVDRLKENSKTAEQAGRQRMQAVLDRRKAADPPAGNAASRPTESTLSRIVLPTRADIDALDAQITRLSQQIDEMAAKSA